MWPTNDKNACPGASAMRTLALVSAAALLLAGCSQSSADGPEPTTDFDELNLAPTATTGVIRGVVVDEAIRPLANAIVTLTPGDKTAQSNANGLFGFQGLDPGTYFLRVEKAGYNATQTSTAVVAGVVDPATVRVLLVLNPRTTPYFEAFSYDAFITCGFAIVVTSVGCNTFPDIGEALGDSVYFHFDFEVLPWWTQGELVWEQTQAAGGSMIWEAVNNNVPPPQPHYGYRETGPSPALAYINQTILEEEQEWVLEDGITYRIFGGPHPTCTGVGFGCGVTLNQRFSSFVHHFYNFVPFEGWRFTVDGEPVVPQ
jgi:hypothetical protein